MSDTLNTPIYPGARSGQGAYDYLSSEEMRALADSYPNQHRPDPYEEAYQDLQNRIHLKKFERHELKCSIVHDFRMMILNGIQNSEVCGFYSGDGWVSSLLTIILGAPFEI